MKKYTILGISMLFFSSISFADELSIIGHGFSKHLDNHNFNQKNYGIGMRLDKNDDLGIQTGYYYNSIRKNTFYVGFDYSPLHYDMGNCLKISSGLYSGIATGYEYKITPMIGLQSSIKCDNFFIRTRLMPDPFYNSKLVGAVEAGFVIKKF